jgi:hypothetical protein
MMSRYLCLCAKEKYKRRAKAQRELKNTARNFFAARALHHSFKDVSALEFVLRKGIYWAS